MSQPVPGPMQSLDDHRIEARRRVMKSGKITFSDFAFSRECAVRDLSDSGARLSVAGPQEIPNEFHLVLSSDRIMRKAMVKWRRGNELGVSFLGEPVNIIGNIDPRLRQFMY